jgi:hypothetical protein
LPRASLASAQILAGAGKSDAQWAAHPVADVQELDEVGPLPAYAGTIDVVHSHLARTRSIYVG